MVSNSYELMMETDTNIIICNFPHNRKGINNAFNAIKNQSNLIAATITSIRDGVIYEFPQNKG